MEVEEEALSCVLVFNPLPGMTSLIAFLIIVRAGGGGGGGGGGALLGASQCAVTRGQGAGRAHKECEGEEGAVGHPCDGYHDLYV